MAAFTNPIRTALCSFGMSGRVFHAPFISVSPYYRLVSVLERTKKESLKYFPEINIYRDIDELLKDESIELVIVNTPNSTHFDFAKKALNAGKHVLVEKPFTITVREGIQLKELAEKKDLVLSVYHNRRFDSDYKTIQKILKKKMIGEVVEAEMRFDRFRVKPGHKLHKEVPGPGTGNLYDLGSHILDQAIQLFGMPKEIFADIAIQRKKSKVDDYFELLLFYNDLRVRLHSSYLVLDPLPGYVLYGTKGSFIKAKTNIQEERLSNGELPTAKDWGIEPSHENGILKGIKNGTEFQKIIISEKGNYQEYYDQLYHAIRNGKPVPVTAEDAIRVIHLIELAYKSNKLKKVITVKDLFK